MVLTMGATFLFRQVEIDTGGRDRLLSLVRKHLKASPRHRGYIYEYLAKWPFACYLTTNYDDELFVHLKPTGQYFTTLQNRREDFQVMRDGVTNVILKLHGDLDHSSELILTSRDYDCISVGTEYFRVRLRAVLETFNVLIVGHSLTDFDLDLILKEAKQTAALHNPIYMVAPGVSTYQQREYQERYNIVLIPYKNSDGTHAQLRWMFANADKLIPSRDALIPFHVLTPEAEAQVNAATSLLIFRRTQSIRNASSGSTEYLGPLVLETLRRSRNLTAGEFLKSDPLQLLTKNDEQTAAAIQATLHDLRTQGLVAGSIQYSLTKTGEQELSAAVAARTLERDQALGQFMSAFESECPSATEDDKGRRKNNFTDSVESCSSIAELLCQG